MYTFDQIAGGSAQFEAHSDAQVFDCFFVFCCCLVFGWFFGFWFFWGFFD